MFATPRPYWCSRASHAQGTAVELMPMARGRPPTDGTHANSRKLQALVNAATIRPACKAGFALARCLQGGIIPGSLVHSLGSHCSDDAVHRAHLLWYLKRTALLTMVLPAVAAAAAPGAQSMTIVAARHANRQASHRPW